MTVNPPIGLPSPQVTGKTDNVPAGVIGNTQSQEAKVPTIGEFEELIMLAIIQHGNNTYGVPIHRTVQENAERRLSIGAIYTALDRLKNKQMISSREGEPTPERGGRAKRYYTVTARGLRALDDAQHKRNRIGRLSALKT